MGQKASDTRGITFEDVVVPKEVRLTLQSACGFKTKLSRVFVGSRVPGSSTRLL